MPEMFSGFGFILAVIVLVLALKSFGINQEYQRGVVFRLGRFSSVKGPGLYWIIPVIDWQKRVDIRTSTVAVEQQETITRDSVTVKVIRPPSPTPGSPAAPSQSAPGGSHPSLASKRAPRCALSASAPWPCPRASARRRRGLFSPRIFPPGASRL